MVPEVHKIVNGVAYNFILGVFDVVGNVVRYVLDLKRENARVKSEGLQKITEDVITLPSLLITNRNPSNASRSKGPYTSLERMVGLDDDTSPCCTGSMLCWLAVS